MKTLNMQQVEQVSGGGRAKLIKKAAKWVANAVASSAAYESGKKAINSVRKRINRAPKNTDCGTRSDPCG